MKYETKKKYFNIINDIITFIEEDKWVWLALVMIFGWLVLLAVGLWQTKANSEVHIQKNVKQVSYFQKVSKEFRKNDETRIKYVAKILKDNWYCKSNCMHIWIVANAIIKAEWWDKTIYWTKIYHNPFHIKTCMSKWYELWLVKKQWKFCIFKNYKSSIIAWWRLWKANWYNSNSLRTAKIYTWRDKARQWLYIIRYYKNKFNYLNK